MMYSVDQYGRMILDHLRMDAYAQALRRSIKPGSVVVDIGTGTGIHALMACELGARKVYAIEPANGIRLAKEIVAANGYSQSVEFIQDISTKVTIPEQADVIISDLHGVMPWFCHHIPSIIDARKRLLKPDGTLLPQQDQLWGVVVDAPKLSDEYTSPWQDKPYGFDMQAGLKISTNSWGRGRAEPDQFLTDPVSWALLDYATIEDANLTTDIAWTVQRTGTGHGCILWFDTTVADGIKLTSAPHEPEISYGSAFFPWSHPVDLTEGDQVCLSLRANLIGDDYVWSWNTLIFEEGNPEAVKASFKQSTFLNKLYSMEQLRKRSNNYKPRLDEQGQILKLVLESVNGDQTLEEIAHQVSEKFSERYPTWQEALNYIRDFSSLYA